MSQMMKGNSQAIISSNIAEMRKMGQSEASATAAAMRMANQWKMKPKHKKMPADERESGPEEKD
jgi:hypothetical protein